MPISPTDCVQNSSDPTPQFRKAPWFILRDSSIKSNGDALILSVIWAAIQGSGDDKTTCKITNEEIAKRSGIRGGGQAALKHLQKLEKLGFIKRHGSHCNRMIELLLQPPPDDNLLGLTIDEDILISNLSPTKKLLASIIRHFTYAKKHWICEQLGIKEMQYFQNIKEVEPYKKTKCNPIRKLSEPYKKTNLLSIDSIDIGIGVLSKDNTKEPSVLFVKEVPSKENPPIEQINLPTKKEYNMPIRIPYTTKAPAGTVEEHLRLWELETLKPIQRNDFKKKKVGELKKYPIEVTLDMNWIRENLNLVRSPRLDTKEYHKDTRVVKALIYGPSNYLRPDEIQAIVNNMKGKIMPGGNYPLTEKVLRERFLDRTFDQAERRELYQLLNNMLGVDYGGKGEKIYLSGAMRSHKGYSFLARVWMANPVKIVKQMPIDLKSVERELELAIDIIPKKIMPEDKPRLASNIINLKKRYVQEYRLKTNGNSIGRNTWPEFFKEFLDSIEDAAEIVNVGWFNPDNKPVKNFLDSIGVDRLAVRPELRMMQPGL